MVDQDEINELSRRYGTPTIWTRTLDVSAETIQERQKKNDKRRGEVVLVMPRPEERVLLHTKGFYPLGCYRLPTGGIDLGERVQVAAQREIHEETGLDASLSRLLGVVEYRFQHQDQFVDFVSYVFMTSLTDQAPHVVDESERITDFRQVQWHELTQIADRLEHLPSKWRDWGLFRAIPHRLVLETIDAT